MATALRPHGLSRGGMFGLGRGSIHLNADIAKMLRKC